MILAFKIQTEKGEKMRTRSGTKRNPTDPSSPLTRSHNKPFTSPSSLSFKSVLLHDWWLLKAGNNRISVSGLASRESLGIRIFVSSPISSRIDATTLETVDGITITITGFINRSRTQENGIPSVVCNQFLLGFPICWEECVAQCYSEEPDKRDDQTRKSGFVEDNTSTMPFTLDNLPATSIFNLVMSLNEESESCICDVILENCRGNATQRTPVSADPNLKKCSRFATANDEGNEDIKSSKKAKNDKSNKDSGNDGLLDAKDKEEQLTQSIGVVTRSMSRSAANKNLSARAARALKSGSKT